jgi:hypothetical protein
MSPFPVRAEGDIECTCLEKDISTLQETRRSASAAVQEKPLHDCRL